MPGSVYLPLHKRHPSWWDHVLVHPNDHGVAVIAFLIGGLMAVSPWTGLVPGDSMAAMPAQLIASVGVMLTLGSVLVVRGLHWGDAERMSVGWRVEQAGWALITGGLVAFAITAGYTGASAAAVILAWTFGVSSAIRWLSFRYIRRNAQVRRTRGKAADG